MADEEQNALGRYLDPTAATVEASFRRILPDTARGNQMFDLVRLVLSAASLLFAAAYLLGGVLMVGITGIVAYSMWRNGEPFGWILLLPASAAFACLWLGIGKWREGRAIIRKGMVSTAMAVTGEIPHPAGRRADAQTQKL
ncbi:MAG: hypothetical protein DI582_05405 [Azospirillum brasilense]|nr:MAG: hypothetical protein DI582_05405 [Azospirillum brasilense]